MTVVDGVAIENESELGFVTYENKKAVVQIGWRHDAYISTEGESETEALLCKENVSAGLNLENADVLTSALIRLRYTPDQELAIQRQRDTKPEEFAEYNAFAESAKAKAKEVFPTE